MKDVGLCDAHIWYNSTSAILLHFKLKSRQEYKFHKEKGKLVTLTSVQVPGRYGNIDTTENGEVKNFQEKPEGDGMWINGGFFVMEAGIFKYLEGDMYNVQWEKKPLIEIANDGNLAAYKHEGFWKCMDAIRDKIELEAIWESENPDWKIWK